MRKSIQYSPGAGSHRVGSGCGAVSGRVFLGRSAFNIAGMLYVGHKVIEASRHMTQMAGD